MSRDVKFIKRHLTLAAGERKRVHEVASFFMLVSNTGTLEVKIAIDDSSLSDCPIGYEYNERKEDTFFKHIDFKNPNAVEVTIEYIMSTGLVRSSPSIPTLDDILTQLGVLDTILTQLAKLDTISGELQGIETAGTDGAEKTIGVAQSTVLAANATRKGFNLQAKSTNTGKIYLGFTNGVTTNIWFAELQAGVPCMMDDYRGPVFAIADAAAQKLGWGEW